MKYFKYIIVSIAVVLITAGIVSAKTVLFVPEGGTGSSSFGSHMVVSYNGTAIVSTSTPTFGATYATSTTATSTFSGAVSIGTTTSLTGVGLNIGLTRLRFGPKSYEANYVPSCPLCSYFVMDKGQTNDDTSIVFRDQGNARAEIGLVGDNKLHIKTVTGTYGSESFTDAMVITAGRVGIGGLTDPATALDVLGTASTTNLVVGGGNGTLRFTADTDGGDYNIFSANGAQTLALYGSAGNTLNLNMLDGALTVGGSTSTLAGLRVSSAGLRVDSLNAANCDVMSTTDGTFYCGTNGAGSQTPWTQNIDGGGYNLSNAGTLTFTTMTATSTTGTSTFYNTVGIGTTTISGNSLFAVGTSTWTGIHVDKLTGKVGIGCINTSPALGVFGCGSNVNVNPNIKFLVQDTSDARMGASAADQGVFIKSSGGLYAYDYALGSGRALALNEFGGNVGVGSTSPWAALSVVNTSLGQPFFALATSTTNAPFFSMSATSTDVGGDLARVIIGSPSVAQKIAALSNNLLDQLNVSRINTGDWFNLECTADFAKKTAQVTGDITGSLASTTQGYICGDFSIIEDTNGVIDYVVTQGSGYSRLRPGTSGTTQVAGDGIGYALTTAFMYAATNTPIIEASVKVVPQTSTTSIYYVGFTNTTGVSPNYDTLPSSQTGCYFTASTTRSNWAAVCNNAGSFTIQDTGVASTTSTFYNLRVEMSNTQARFFISTTSSYMLTNVITTNIPTTSALNPQVSVAKAGSTAGGNVAMEFWVRWIRMWYKDPVW